MGPSPHGLLYSHWATSLVVAYAALVLVSYAMRTAFVGRAVDPRLAKERGTAFVGRWPIEAFYWSFRVFGQALIRSGIAPDTLTWASLVASLACVPAAALGHFSLAGIFYLAGAAFDAFDGIVARERGIASDAGEMLDAIIDRYADMAPLVGLVIFYRFSDWQMAIPLAALVGSIMVSYVRAKTEALDLELPSGAMRRHERITYVVSALVLGPEVSPWLPQPFGAVHPAMLAVVLLVALISNYAAFRLSAAARDELVRIGRGPKA